MNKPTAALALTGALSVLAACDRQDTVFGRSYDACVLRNVNRVADDDRRAAADDICARHFERDATARERSAVKSVVTFVAARTPPPNANDLFTSNSFGEDYAAHISVEVTNNTQDAIIKKVDVKIEFYAAADLRTKTGKPLTTSLDTTIEPGATQTLTSDFIDPPLTAFVESKVVPAKVVLRTATG